MGLRRTLWTVFVLSGCTQTAEVLTKRVQGQQSAVTTETNSSVSPVEAGSPTPTNQPSEPTTSASSSFEPHSELPDAAPSAQTSEPQPEIFLPPPLAVGAGHNTTCVIINDGQTSVLLCFGEDEIEPLGLSEEDADTTRGSFISVTGGERHMCTVDTFGDVYCWGDNSNGQLGSAGVDFAAKPRRVVLPEPVAQLSSGAGHVCAITEPGRLYCWGNNSEGQLGIGDDAPGEEDSRGNDRNEPALVDAGPWISVAAGNVHTCGVKSDGTLLCWGRNVEQQAGSNGETELRIPTLVNTEHSWKQAAAGLSHSCGLRTDGTLWCWGRNTSEDAGYPLGIESEWQLVEPTPVVDGRWTSVAASAFHTCATSEARELWCWGRNDEGQLGTGDTELRRTPTFLLNDATQAVTGRYHSCVVTNQDDVLCTGSNEFGQLGLPSDEPHATFTSLRDEWERYIDLHFER